LDDDDSSNFSNDDHSSDETEDTDSSADHNNTEESKQENNDVNEIDCLSKLICFKDIDTYIDSISATTLKYKNIVKLSDKITVREANVDTRSDPDII